MRALHVIARYWPYAGGSEGYFQEISERLVADGHAVTVYATDAWDLEYFWNAGKRRVPSPADLHNGVRIRRFPVRHLPRSQFIYPATRRLMTYLSRVAPLSLPALRLLCRSTPFVPDLPRALSQATERFDLVHCANILLDSLMYSALVFARRTHVPFVATPFLHLGEPSDGSVRKHYTMAHQLEMLRLADRVFVQTEIEGDFLRHVGVVPERLVLLGMGVDVERASGGDGGRFRQRHGIPGPLVFYVGAQAYDKGTQHLVEAMRTLWARGSVAHLVLAGPVTEPFQQYYDALPQDERARCHLLGAIPEEEKLDLYAAGDVFAMPSRTDSFGIVFLEAWLHGVPVIGARAGGIPGVVEDGRDGYLVRFGDVPALAQRIEELLNDRRLAAALGANGEAKVRAAFTWEKKYAIVRKTYEDLVSAAAV